MNPYPDARNLHAAAVDKMRKKYPRTWWLRMWWSGADVDILTESWREKQHPCAASEDHPKATVHYILNGGDVWVCTSCAVEVERLKELMKR